MPFTIIGIIAVILLVVVLVKYSRSDDGSKPHGPGGGTKPGFWEWVFTPGMVASYNTKELTQILVALLAADRSAMCYLFLSQFDGSLGVVLESAIEAERTRVGDAPPNAAARQAEAFRLILCSDYAVLSEVSFDCNIHLRQFSIRSGLHFPVPPDLAGSCSAH